MVGVTDSLLCEAICACVVSVEGAIVTGQEVMDWCRDTLAEDKVPGFVCFIDELPSTDTGQVRRTDLSLGSAPGTVGVKGGCDTRCEWLRRLP